jgi:putative photosynthetic complex assembly protein
MHDDIHDHRHDNMIPRALLAAILGVMLFAFAAVVIGRATDTGLRMTAPAPVAEERRLTFHPMLDGALEVRDADDGRMVALLAAGKDGFIRGVLRGLARGRAVGRADGAEVYVLTRWTDGRVSLTDPVSGETFDLNSFGVDNVATVASLLKSREIAR